MAPHGEGQQLVVSGGEMQMRLIAESVKKTGLK